MSAHTSQNQSSTRSMENAKAASPCSKIVTKANGGIEIAIMQAQKKARMDAKENDEMWGRIAKAVDVAMTAESQAGLKKTR